VWRLDGSNIISMTEVPKRIVWGQVDLTQLRFPSPPAHNGRTSSVEVTSSNGQAQHVTQLGCHIASPFFIVIGGSCCGVSRERPKQCIERFGQMQLPFPFTLESIIEPTYS
jgi:hypothetical protein